MISPLIGDIKYGNFTIERYTKRNVPVNFNSALSPMFKVLTFPLNKSHLINVCFIVIIAIKSNVCEHSFKQDQVSACTIP